MPFLFDYDIENLFKLSRYRQIAIKKQKSLLSRVRNSMETKLGQYFQLLKVRNHKGATIQRPTVHRHYANEFANVHGAHAIVGVSQLNTGDLL